VDLFWGAGPIPDGVRIMITGVEVKGKNGADIHEASGVSCQPPCHDYMFAAGGSCQVAVGWTPNHPPNDLIGTIGLGGKCVAPDEPTCDQMKATVKSETGPLAEIKVLAQNTSSVSSEPSASSEPSVSDSSAGGAVRERWIVGEAMGAGPGSFPVKASARCSEQRSGPPILEPFSQDISPHSAPT
jgi:hypothetical protein